MNELKYGGLAAALGGAAAAISIAGLALHSPALVLLALPEVFTAGWCAAKASFE